MAIHQDEKLSLIIGALKKEFQPKRMFLFGSRANGSNHADSDYDIVLVVENTQKTRIQNMRLARQIVRETAGVSADVFVYDEAEFEEWKEEFSSIPETAINTGKEIDLG
jgi:predicted nucleotidyltransferase